MQKAHGGGNPDGDGGDHPADEEGSHGDDVKEPLIKWESKTGGGKKYVDWRGGLPIIRASDRVFGGPGN
jgi:hypothetical protein